MIRTKISVKKSMILFALDVVVLVFACLFAGCSQNGGVATMRLNEPMNINLNVDEFNYDIMYFSGIGGEIGEKHAKSDDDVNEMLTELLQEYAYNADAVIDISIDHNGDVDAEDAVIVDMNACDIESNSTLAYIKMSVRLEDFDLDALKALSFDPRVSRITIAEHYYTVTK